MSFAKIASGEDSGEHAAPLVKSKKTKPQPNVDAKKMFVSLFGCFLRHNAKTNHKLKFRHYSQNEKYSLFKGDHGRDGNGIGLVFKLILLALDNKFPKIELRDFFEIPKNRHTNDKNAIKFKNIQNSVTSDIVNNFGKRLIKVALLNSSHEDEDLVFYSPTLDSSKQVLYRVRNHYEVNENFLFLKELTTELVDAWDTFYDTKIKGKTNGELNDIDLFGGAKKQLTQRKRREGNPWPSPFFLTVADIDSIDDESSCRDLVTKINAEQNKNHFKHTLQNIRGVNQMYDGTMTARWDDTKKKCQIELNYDGVKEVVSFSGEGGLMSFTRQGAKFVWKNGKPDWFEDALNNYDIRKQNNKKRRLDEREAVMALWQLGQAISVRDDAVESDDELVDDEKITIRNYFNSGWSLTSRTEELSRLVL